MEKPKLIRQESARPAVCPPRQPPLRPGCLPPTSWDKRVLVPSDDEIPPTYRVRSSSSSGVAAPCKKRKRNAEDDDDDDATATASVYKENNGNFINFLTKEQGVNYKMKRARG